MKNVCMGLNYPLVRGKRKEKKRKEKKKKKKNTVH
jgi:hypothetical protein